MATNVEMTKKKNENATQLLRRFTRRFRETGITREIRNRRYFDRQDSDLRRKRGALRRIEDGKKYGMLRKLGRM
ncbi:30S ribosomal protein S21 [Candidatus Nomurabacteria bacterium]|nr:30S ribosomal protein S21 [Candidatus Nomurabacteria bacterium]